MTILKLNPESEGLPELIAELRQLVAVLGGSLAEPAHVPNELRPVEAAILEATPRSTQRPANLRQLSQRAGYSYNHVRATVHILCDHRPPLLVRVVGGFRRAPLVDNFAS